MRIRSFHRAGGFTLIELLVVIAIIGVLVSMLMPSLANVRKQARQVKCLANLKGIGVGIAAYMQSTSRGVLPHVLPLHDSGGNQNDPSLLDVLAEHVDAPPPRKEADGRFVATAPWICPEDTSSTDAASNFEPTWRTYGTSYEYTAGAVMLIAETSMHVPRERLARVVTGVYDRAPREMGVLADAQEWHVLRRTPGDKKNMLYYKDWRADWARPVDADEVGAVMTEILRTAGGN